MIVSMMVLREVFGGRFDRPTFLQAREPEEFDEPQVISGHQHGTAVVGIHRIHIGDV